MNIKKLIEEINNLTEDELVDDFEDTEVAEVVDTLDDTTNVTDTLDAKVKISRALDVLKDAIDDFKDATIEEIDLVKDADLSVIFEDLDNIISRVTEFLTGKQENTEIPVESTEDEIEEVPQEDEEDEENEEDANFDDEANLDLFGIEDEEQED